MDILNARDKMSDLIDAGTHKIWTTGTLHEALTEIDFALASARLKPFALMITIGSLEDSRDQIAAEIESRNA